MNAPHRADVHLNSAHAGLPVSHLGAAFRRERPRALGYVVPPAAPRHVTLAPGVERVVDAVIGLSASPPDRSSASALPVVDEV